MLSHVPKLWEETIDAHRRTVRETVLETAATLVRERGLRAVTMSLIAEEAGIGRATLYKYFADVDAILLAWHERQIARHLDDLAAVADKPGTAQARLAAVLEAYGKIVRGSRGDFDVDVRALLHRDEQVGRARDRLQHLVRDLIDEAARSGIVRDDVPAAELAAYCLHAAAAAERLPSAAAVRRLVTVTLAGLRRAQ
jgi:AcrR family transcriptional regulator